MTAVAEISPEEAAPAGGFFRTHGPKLAAQGYQIVPISPGSKAPLLQGWPDRDFNCADFKRRFTGFGVGVKGEKTPGVDLDITDAKVLARVVSWCEKNLGPAVARIGRPPRQLLVCRASAPIRKMKSRQFISPDGATHQIEIIGSRAQFVAYHIHPGTGRPYIWPNGELTDTPVDTLPELTEALAYKLFDYFQSIVPKDWQVAKRAASVELASEHRSGNNPRAEAWVLKEAMKVIPIAPEEYDRWIKVGMALHHATDGSFEGLEIWDSWSRTGQKYQDNTSEKWRTFAVTEERSNFAGAGTIFHMADEADRSWRDQAAAIDPDWQNRGVVRRIEHNVACIGEFFASDKGAPVARVVEAYFERLRRDRLHPTTALDVVSLASFHGQVAPPRAWIVPDLIPDRNVTDLSGDGGTGKSLLALQLAIAMVTERRWIGHAPVAGRVLYVSCEDEIMEIRRRAEAIVASEGLALDALSDLLVLDLTVAPSTELAVTGRDRQSLELTPLFNGLAATISELRPKLLILDTRADVFAGNEIDRAQVRAFIRSLRQLCFDHDLAVLMLSHPSMNGMSSGSGQSGSTAWGNSVRSRLYLERLSGGGTQPDPDMRTLKSLKANYGSADAEIALRWHGGVFRPQGPGGASLDRSAREQQVDARFLELLRECEISGRHVNHAGGPYYAPKQFAAEDGTIGHKQFRASMDRLFRYRKIRVEPHGPPSRGTKKIVEVTP